MDDPPPDQPATTASPDDRVEPSVDLTELVAELVDDAVAEALAKEKAKDEENKRAEKEAEEAKKEAADKAARDRPWYKRYLLDPWLLDVVRRVVVATLLAFVPLFGLSLIRQGKYILALDEDRSYFLDAVTIMALGFVIWWLAGVLVKRDGETR